MDVADVVSQVERPALDHHGKRWDPTLQIVGPRFLRRIADLSQGRKVVDTDRAAPQGMH